MTKAPHSASRLLRTYLMPHWPTLLLLLGALAAATAVQLGLPRILGSFIDRAIGGADANVLLGLATSYLLLAVTNQVFTLGSTYFGQRMAWMSTNALRSDLFRHCLGLGLSFHSRRTPGELIQRIDGDVGSLSNFMSQFSVRIVGNAMLLGGVLVLLFRTQWRVGLVLSVFAALALLVLRLTRNLAVPANREMNETMAKLIGFIEERLGGLSDIRANGAVQYVMNGLFLFGRRRYRTLEKGWVMGSVRWSVAMFVFLAGNVLALGIGAWLMLSRQASLGTVFVIYNYTNLLLDPLRAISDQLQDFQKASAGMLRVLELFAVAPERVAAGDGVRLPEGALSVELDGLGFAYEVGVPVLESLTMSLEPGKMLGVIGRTGSGKSTLARLLLRLYDPTEGGIRIGGQDIGSLSLRDIRGRVALVTQEVQLFHASVRDNLTLFADDIADDKLLWAIGQVGLTDWLASLPAGLDSRLGGSDAGMSEGQAQLLAFARVLMRNPGLVILDEASSRLDPATERLLEGAMARLLQGRTAVVIAHHLSTLDRADAILVLDAGSVVEFGERDALAADVNSHYSRLRRLGLEEMLA